MYNPRREATMKDVFQALLEALKAGETVALLTVVRASGSTPRHLPSNMLVRADGSCVGSIGGGTLELQAIQNVRAAIAEGRPRLADYNLTGKEPGNVGLCGGTEQVFIDVIRGQGVARGIFEAVVNALEAGESIALATVVQADAAPRLGAKMLVRGDGSTLGSLGDARLTSSVRQVAPEAITAGASRRIAYVERDGCLAEAAPGEQGSVDLFIEVMRPNPTLLLIGAGHIGEALMRMAKMLAWRVVVVDDRPDFITPLRLPEADERILVPYDPQTERLDQMLVRVTPSTYIVIATWGWDEPALRQVVNSSAAYIGLVASPRKAIVIFRDLLREGFSADALARVRVPTGLDLGAETPAEIALSIMAEMLMVQRRATAMPLMQFKGSAVMRHLKI